MNSAPKRLVIYPDSQTIEAVRSLQDRRRFSIEDTLDASDVIPGLIFAVSAVFA